MANEITADLTSQLPQPRLITFHWQKTLHLRWAEVVAGSDFVSGISCGFFKGEVWSRKILPLLVELFHRNSKLISFFPVCFAITTTALSSCSYLPLSRPEKRHLGYDVSYDVAIVKPCCSSLWPSWPDRPFWRVFLMRVELWSTVL